MSKKYGKYLWKDYNKIEMKTYIIGLILAMGILASPQMVMADDTYFRFDIPTMVDGSRVHYSPGWFGVMDKCPQDVTVLYFNDNDGYGYAVTSDAFIPPEIMEVEASVVDNVLDTAEEEEGIYCGTKLDDRWLPEVCIETRECVIDENGEVVFREGNEIYSGIVFKQAVFCPYCGEFIMWAYDGISDSREILTCQCGQRSVTKTYD